MLNDMDVKEREARRLLKLLRETAERQATIEALIMGFSLGLIARDSLKFPPESRQFLGEIIDVYREDGIPVNR